MATAKDVMDSIREFREEIVKRGFIPMPGDVPQPQQAMPPQGAPPMQGQPMPPGGGGMPPTDPAMMQGGPPQGGSPASPGMTSQDLSQHEQADGDTFEQIMQALQELYKTVESLGQDFDGRIGQLEQGLEQQAGIISQMADEVKQMTQTIQSMPAMDGSIGGPGQPPMGMGGGDPNMMGGGDPAMMGGMGDPNGAMMAAQQQQGMPMQAGMV